MVLVPVKRSHPELMAMMERHYSAPKGFVGRNIAYLIRAEGATYGGIVGGSATLHLVGRDNYFHLQPESKREALLSIVNNIFFHIEGPYPERNFAQRVLREFREEITEAWEKKYGDEVAGFESLVELPRTGEVYKRDHWTEVGITKGQTCKRVAASDPRRGRLDSWTGKRVWDMANLRPKRVFVRGAETA
jgi:hypothetical protein